GLLMMFQGCGNDDQLSSDETLQALLRARWSAAMVNQARQIVEPLQELPLDFDAEALQTVLDEAYGACAQATKGTDGNATHWSIVIDTSCESPTPHCVGSFRIA